jgi:hypothetical protein
VAFTDDPNPDDDYDDFRDDDACHCNQPTCELCQDLAQFFAETHAAGANIDDEMFVVVPSARPIHAAMVPYEIQKADPKKVEALLAGYGATVDYVADQHKGTGSPLLAADIGSSFLSMLHDFCEHMIAGKISSRPDQAHANKQLVLRELERLKTKIDGWDVPEPVKH